MTFWPGSHGLALAETDDLASHPELIFRPWIQFGGTSDGPLTHTPPDTWFNETVLGLALF